MKLLDAFAISGLINGLIVLGLGIFIISHNWKEKTNRLYFLIILATSLWSFSYWRWLSSTDATSALFWVRLLSVGSTLIPIFYFHWVVSLLKIENSQKLTIRLTYILGGLFLLFSFSNLFVSGTQQKLFFPFWPNPGILYHFYLFSLYICLVIYSVNLLIKNYKQAFGEEKKRIAYILGGTVMAFGGGLSNFFLWYNIPVAPYGNFLVAFFPFLFGYATIKYRLFNIQVVTTELFTIAIWVFLFIKTLISNSVNDLLVNAILFIVVVFFGILLIRSVFREVKQKEQIEKIEKELEKAYEIEKKANKELEELGNVKNQFLMTIQHHLRTPLTSMRGYADLLLDGTYGKVPKKIEGIIKNFEESTISLIKMVNDFLDVTQFQLGKGTVSLKEGVNLSAMIKGIVSDVKLEADGKGIYLKLEKPEADCIIKADESKLKAALVNIFDNAVKYTKEGGITVKLKSEGAKGYPKVKIEIKDTGMGISKERLPKLFDNILERTEAAKKSFNAGRGVGLYLSSQIIKAHNGRVWAESEGEGKGSTFTIELPIR